MLIKTIIFIVAIIALTVIKSSAQCPTVKYTVSQTHEVYGNVLSVQTQSITLPTTVPYGTPYIQYGLKMNTQPYTTFIKLNAFDSLVSNSVPVSWNIGTADTLVVSAELIYMAYDSNGVLQVTNPFVPCIQEDTLILSASSSSCPVVDYSITQTPFSWGERITCNINGVQNVSPNVGEVPFFMFSLVEPNNSLYSMNDYAHPLTAPTVDVTNGTDSFTIRVDVLYLTLYPSGLIDSIRFDSGCAEYKTFALQNTNTGISETTEAKNKIYGYQKTITIQSDKRVKSYMVYDMTGRVVINDQSSENDGTVKIQTNLPIGIYIVVATMEDGTQTSSKVPIQ